MAARTYGWAAAAGIGFVSLFRPRLAALPSIEAFANTTELGTARIECVFSRNKRAARRGSMSDFFQQRAYVRKVQMMRIRRTAAAEQARLAGDKSRVLLGSDSARFWRG